MKKTKKRNRTGRKATRRKPRRNPRGYILAVALLIAVVLQSTNFAGCTPPDENESTPSGSEIPAIDSKELMKVEPSAPADEQIVEYKGMTVSFNQSKHVPNWVAWELTRDEVHGTVPRAKGFKSDPRVKGCPEPWDYSNSGYDRGHMAPAGDMKWDRQAMEESFYMTNVCPQANQLNSGTWNRLEEKCRVWADVDSAIIIIAGPILTDDLTETIGATKVIVPKRFFKVILSPYAVPPRGIGFIMNNGRVEGGMQNAAVSIDEVESATGYDFFSALPDSIENEVEQQCRFHYWSTLK